MEVQVTVLKGQGERLDDFKGKNKQIYSDGINTWYPIRIPKNAKTEPEYTDGPMTYALEDHAEGIGLTGWNWKEKVSKWVAFDFDAITGHSDKHNKKLTDLELKQIQEQACAIPWITVRKSTSGKGLHLYVFLPNTPTSNHDEHAALGRAILEMMSGVTGFDFYNKSDSKGSNMWIWHRKMQGTDGLSLIKTGEILETIPPNWRDYIDVIKGKRKKSLPSFIEKSEEKVFEELTGRNVKIKLNDDHKKLIEWLQSNNYTAAWYHDHNMLVTHTYALKRAFQELNLKGIYDTIAQGSDINDHNCFAYPLPDGGWIIRRYTPGVKEANTWDIDNKGWTYCHYNRTPDLASASKAYGGKEYKKGGFFFDQVSSAIKAVEMLGLTIEIPESIHSRSAILKPHPKDGRLIFEIEKSISDDPKTLPDWINEAKIWSKIFNLQVHSISEPQIGNYDELVRHLIVNDENYGWVIRKGDTWIFEPLSHLNIALSALGFNVKDTKQILGSSIFRAWKLVNKPFQPEFPGDRQWNRKAPQLRYFPSSEESPSCPTWNNILEHVGKNLNDSLKSNEWAKANGIDTGADYLKCWIASIFQDPYEPLPYLFLYGPENCGKSILHESIALLITEGVMAADTALTSSSSFNGELVNSILCYVEETDLRKSRQAANRIKAWVTSPMINIHPKGETPYLAPNTTHWIQCANDHLYCPIFPGDTRITVIQVDPLDNIIPKKILKEKLIKEAPDFMAHIMNLELPQSNDRLNIPVILTDEKLTVQNASRSTLEIFLNEECYYVPGETVLFKDFYDRYLKWLDPVEIGSWSKIRVGKELPPCYPSARRLQDNQKIIGNISFSKQASNLPKLILRGERLVSANGRVLSDAGKPD